MRSIKRVLCLIGNYLPPKLNSFFYKLSGVKLNFSQVWIGNKCYFDTMFPENITIKNGVCISLGVTIVCHFDPSESIKKPLIKKYQKKIIIEEGVFIGPNSTIMPGVILRKNSFIMAGTIVTKSTRENSIVFGNPQKEKRLLSRNFISKINSQNKKFFF